MASSQEQQARRLGTLRLNDTPGLLLLALVEPGGVHTHCNPDDQTMVEAGSVRIVMGSPEAAGRLRDQYRGEAVTPLEGAQVPARS